MIQGDGTAVASGQRRRDGLENFVFASTERSTARTYNQDDSARLSQH